MYAYVFLVLYQQLQAETNWFYWVATFRYSTLKTDICWNWRFGSDMTKNMHSILLKSCLKPLLPIEITILLSTCHTVFWRVLFWWFWILSQLIAHVNHLAPNLNHCSETHKSEFHGKRKVYSSGNIDIKNCSNIILNHLSVLYRFINSEFHLFCRAVPWYIYLVIDVLSISAWIKKRKG